MRVTRAPDNLLAVRKLLLDYLDVEPTLARSIDLEPGEVGIVGDAAHAGEGDSYHLGLPEQSTSGYSVRESERDRALSQYACALDVGSFTVTTPKGTYDLPHFSAWCVAQCKANAPDTRDIREVIYSLDGKNVRRWDRLGRRSTGDTSHRWHTHFSYFRDAIKAGRDQTPLFRRYLTAIGLLEDDMTPDQFVALLKDPQVAAQMRALPWQYTGGGIPAGMSTLGVLNQTLVVVRALAETVARESASPDEIRALLAQLPKPTVDVDEQAIVTGVLAGLNPAEIAKAVTAAMPTDQARRVADELAARLAS